MRLICWKKISVFSIMLLLFSLLFLPNHLSMCEPGDTSVITPAFVKSPIRIDEESQQNTSSSYVCGDPDGVTTKWAVLIAASGGPSYERHERRDRNDIMGLNQVLKKNGWDDDHIFVLLEEEATTDAIINDSFNWLKQNGEDEDDLILFFISGHGYYHTEDQPPLDEPDGRDEIFHPWDPDMAGWNPDVFIVDDVLAEKFNTLKSRNIIIIMHTCHAGGWIDGSKDLCGSGRVVLTACDVDESSYMLIFPVHWMFPYYCIKGLRGHGDSNTDGFVSAEELLEYTLMPVIIRSTLQSYYNPKMSVKPQHPQMYDGWPTDKDNQEELNIIDLTK